MGFLLNVSFLFIKCHCLQLQNEDHCSDFLQQSSPFLENFSFCNCLIYRITVYGCTYTFLRFFYSWYHMLFEIPTEINKQNPWQRCTSFSGPFRLLHWYVTQHEMPRVLSGIKIKTEPQLFITIGTSSLPIFHLNYAFGNFILGFLF